MGGFKLVPSLLHATLLFFFAGSLVGASVKCPSNKREELTRNTKEYVLVCGYPTKASTILKHSKIENAEDCADLCSKNSRCVHAEWRPSEKTCSLKSAGSIAIAGETVYNWRKKGTELDFEDDEASFPELESDEEGFGDSEQGFGESEQGFGESEQGFGESEQGFGESEQGFGESEQGFGESEQGFGGSEQGFTDPDERSTDPEEGFTDPGPGTGEKDLPSSCPAALAGFGIETAVRESMEVCCPDASAEHEVLIKDYMAIVNNALSLIARYCEKSCEPQAPLCFGLPVYPQVVQTAGITAALKDLPQTTLAKGDHVFDFDTLLGPVKPGFELYSSQRAMTTRQNYAGDNFYMIRAGTKASDLQYIASEPTELRYHASCSEDIPCIYRTEKPWTSFSLDSNAELALDFSAYEVDMVLSVADVWGTLEQYAVFVEGKEIGRTHGALSLKARGQDPYDPAMMPKDHVGEIPDGPSKTIIGRGFWGSFKIPKGTKLVVIKMIYPTDLKGGGAYRIDRGCN